MPSSCLKNNIKIIAISSILLASCSFAEAKDFDLDFIKIQRASATDKAGSSPRKTVKPPKGEEELSLLGRMARDYRQQGIMLQQAGNLMGAKAFFEKAITADPFYPVAYNDLGVIYEIEGKGKLAEENYLRSIQVDRGFLSGYANLASYYETLRDFKKAAYYWEKRVELGSGDDPWTRRASARLNDIYFAMGKKLDGVKERNIMDLALDTSDQKELIRQDDLAAAEMSFRKAKVHYKRGDVVTAYKETIDAMQLDPANDEIIAFAEKLQLRMLSR